MQPVRPVNWNKLWIAAQAKRLPQNFPERNEQETVLWRLLQMHAVNKLTRLHNDNTPHVCWQRNLSELFQWLWVALSWSGAAVFLRTDFLPPPFPSFSSWSRRMPSGCRRLPDTSPGSSRSLCLTSPNSSAKARREGSYTQVGPALAARSAL